MNTIFKFFLVARTIINFHIAVLDRLGLIHGTVIYKMRKNGIKFIARTGTEDIAEIAVVGSGSEYNFDKIKLSSNPVIIDLGGYIGDFSIPTAKRFKDKCKVYSYEPNKENYELMIKNLQLNKIKSVIPNKTAISSFNGNGYLKTEKLNTDAYHLSEKNKKNNCLVRTLPFELRRLKITKVDLLKMDIEGEEEKIFKHKASLGQIKKSIHYIFIEIGPKYETSAMKKIIDENFITIHKQKNILTLENPNYKN